MPQPVSPQDMAQLQEKAGAKPDPSGAGDVTKLAQMIGQGLSQFAQIISSSPAATAADKKQMSDVLNGFVDLVERSLAGAGPGQEAPPEGGPMRADQGQVPMEAGMNGVPESMAQKN